MSEHGLIPQDNEWSLIIQRTCKQCFKWIELVFFEVFEKFISKRLELHSAYVLAVLYLPGWLFNWLNNWNLSCKESELVLLSNINLEE